MIGEEILIDIDATLDQLIKNAEAIQDVEWEELSETEVELFQKTQESLLQRLLHRDQQLEMKRKDLRVLDKRSAGYKIQEKLAAFEKLNTVCHKNISEKAFSRTAIWHKRRSKRFLSLH